MSDEDSPIETETSINDYTAQFRRNLAEVQAHLAGNVGNSLYPSYIPPTGYWTSLEKNAFFHGLCIHSRFRPDLIAACVHTKSVVDVCTYIDALDKGLSKNSNLHYARATMEGAVEVSDAWVEWEEKHSVDLVSMECDWEEEMLDNREEIVEGSNSKKREKMMRRLDVDHLRHLEAIIRDGEWNSGGDPADHGDHPNTQADEIIDPALLEIPAPAPEIPPRNSSSPLVTQDHNSHTKISQPDTAGLVEEPTVNLSELSPSSRRRLQKRLYMRKKRAQKAGSDFTSVVTKLRPGRKLKEDKPPRSKRSKSKGKSPEDDPDEDPMNVDDDLMDPPSAAVEDSEEDEDDDAKEPTKRHHSKSGLTKPYKIKKEFETLGIDAGFLSQSDLDLFHLSTLSRLMTFVFSPRL